MSETTKKKKHPILTVIAVILFLRAVTNNVKKEKNDFTSTDTGNTVQSERVSNSTYRQTEPQPENYDFVDYTADSSGTLTENDDSIWNTAEESAYISDTCDDYWEGSESADSIWGTTDNETTEASEIYVYEDPYETIERAIINREPQVTVVDGAYTLMWADISTFAYGSFWVSSIQSSYYEENGHDYSTYYFEYWDLTEADIKEMEAQIDARCQEIISRIPENADTFEKCKTVHDILVSEISYDHSDSLPYRWTVYGGLVQGQAICSGYAATYAYLLDQIGIPCQIVHNIVHAFNKVGDTYVDVCWDDHDTTDAYGNAIVLYNYFGTDYNTTNSRESHQVMYITSNNGSDEHILPSYNDYYGYVLSGYDYATVVEILREQYNAGNLFPTIQFTDLSTLHEFDEIIGKDFWSIMAEIGYTYEDYCSYVIDEDTLTCLFYLSDIF